MTATATSRPAATATSTQTPTLTPLPPVIENNGATMLLVPGDFFIMGIVPEALAEECALFGRDCEQVLLASASPQHPVYVTTFYVDTYEVTNEAYSAFLNDVRGGHAVCLEQPCLFLDASRIDVHGEQYEPEPGFAVHPVHNVSWFGAAAFCEWRGARLPSEAEWEMAASWEPTANVKTLYPWGNQFDGSIVNFCDIACTQTQSNGFYDDGFPETAPVGSFPDGRSASGAYDMGGNVWEWVADWFGPTYYSYAPTRNPEGPSSGLARVLRGGSWFDTGNFTATVFRIGLPPHESNDSIGFRCAMSTTGTGG